MKQAKRFLNIFIWVVWAYIVLVVAGALVPYSFDNVIKLLISITKLIISILLFLSVFSYYEWLLHRKKWYRYRLEVAYYDKAGNKLFTLSLEHSQDKHWNQHQKVDKSKTLCKYIYDNHKEYLCNGTMKVKSINYLGSYYKE